MAFAKSQIGAANSLPKHGLAFVSLKDSHKNEGIEKAEQLQNKFTTEAVSLLSQLPNSEDLIDFTEMIGRRKF